MARTRTISTGDLPLQAWLGEAAAHRQSSGRPLVTLSYAQSLDGSLSLARGKTTPISGPEVLELTHQLRTAHAAILVGIGTVLVDNPSLTVRLAQGRHPQPIVLDSQLRLPINAQLLTQDPAPWVFCVDHASAEAYLALESAGALVQRLPADPDGRADLAALLDWLGDAGIDSLMVEGGARVIKSFLSLDLVDLVAITIAPRFVGGLKALKGPPDPRGYPRIQDPQWTQYGEDMLVWGLVARE